MKFRVAGFVVILICATAALVWWLNPTADPAPEPDKATAPSPAPAAAKLAAITPPAPKPAGIVPPKVAPVTQVAAPVATPAPVAAKKADSQANLETAIPDLSNLLQSGDLVTAFENYTLPDDLAQIPPERVVEVEDQLRALVTNPQIQPRLQLISQMLDTFKGQTPTYNETGDRATYQLPGIGTGAATFSFQKVGDHWYISQNGMNQMSRVLGM